MSVNDQRCSVRERKSIRRIDDEEEETQPHTTEDSPL